jgi:hypothetical protein
VTVTTESAAYQREDGLWVIPREEFARDRFDYKPGHHVVFGGPSQRAGKTTLAFKLLEFNATPDFPAYVAVCKPEDRTSASEGRRLGFRRSPDYPLAPRLRDMVDKGNRPPGYLIWPDMSDPYTAMDHCSAVTERLIYGVYSEGAPPRRKKCILVLDDTVTKSQVLGLDKPMVLISTMSGAMGIGGWFFVQKPSDAGKAARWAYPNAEHVFISKDPVKTNREYYDGFSGMKKGIVEDASLTLKPYQFLYIERTHNYICVVDSK